MSIRYARPDEAAEVARLTTLAYRVEDFFVDGDRTNLAEVQTLMHQGTFLVLEDPPGTLAGSIYVTIKDGRGHFAMLAVDPARQGQKLGARLVAGAESHCRRAGCAHMDLHVVSLRTELPPLYRHLGYVEQGTAPFPPTETLKMPCHLLVMTKPL